MSSRERTPGGPLSPELVKLLGLADKHMAPTTSEELTGRWRRLRVGIARRKGGRHMGVLAAAAIVVTAIALTSVATWMRARAAKLSYDVEGGKVLSSGYVEAPAQQNAIVQFSDGTNVTLGHKARVKLASTDADRPRVTLEEGEATVHVFHHEGRHWLFQAGPFGIAVKGTAFVVRWSDQDKWLRIYLKSGSVAITGPLPSGELSMREGQALSVRLREGEILLRDRQGDGGLDAQPARSTSDVVASALPATVEAPLPALAPPDLAARATAPAEPERAASPRKGGDGSRTWGRKLAMGKIGQVVDEALALGLDAAVDETSGADLDALADAARYSGRDDIARRALAAQRRRFAGTTRASSAAFFMGRLEEAAGRAAKAEEWYETYLREAPNGAYASEALGGKMAIVQRIYGNDRARVVAEEYLRKFPGGSYASAAQALAHP